MISRFIAVYGTFCKGVMLRDQLTEPLIQHMRVDLRGRNVGMSEQFLHRAQIGAVSEKMACKGVSQHVRRDEARGNSGPAGKGFEIPGENLTREMPVVG